MRAERLTSVPRRGLRREEAALYIGISATKFGQLVEDGRMPKPIAIDGCQTWDIRDLDLAYEALKDGGGRNEWDEGQAA